MRRLWEFLTLRDSFAVLLPGTLEAVVEGFAAQVDPRRPMPLRIPTIYEGRVKPGGFTIRNIAESKGDFRALVAARGSFQPVGGGVLTRVQVHVRQGRYRIGLHVALVALAAISLISLPIALLEIDSQVSQSRQAAVCGAALVATLCLALSVCLRWNVLSVSKDIEHMLGNAGRFAAEMAHEADWAPPAERG